LVRMPETEPGPRSKFDVAGSILLAVGITSCLLAVNRGSIWGWTSPGVIGGFVVSVAALALFVAAERRAEYPLVPLTWLRRRNVTGPLASQFFANFAYMGGFILAPVLLEEGLGYSTAFVGLLIVARPLAFSITAPAAGYLTVKVRERVAGMAGAAVIFVSMMMLGMIDVDASSTFIAAALAMSGVGLGISAPAMTATVANAVADEDLGVAAAVQQLMTQVGSVVGIQVMQTVQASTEDGAGEVGSFANAYHVGAVAAVVAVALAVVVRPSVPVTDDVGGEALAPATQ
jgi:predicted MFS family arabinose efflux permease